MKSADNFNPGKWLIENKITSQSKLNENNILIPYKKIYDVLANEKIRSADYNEIEKYLDIKNGNFDWEIKNALSKIYTQNKVDDIMDKITSQSRLNEQRYVKIDGDEYYVDEQGNVKISLNFPYKFNRSHRYNTPREEYIDKSNWKEKVNPNFSIMKVINNVPTADYEFIEYESGDKELVVKTNIEDLKKYSDGNYTLR